MLLTVTRFEDLDARKLMDLYAEGNLENTDYFFPDLTDKEEALRKVEQGFLEYLRDDFFGPEGNAYLIWEEDGVWISALRLYRVRDRLYYLEALETHPDYRRRGFASRLLEAALDGLKAEGAFRLCDCVSKRNEASVRTHLRCGFRIAAEEGYDYLTGERDERDYGFEYRYPEEEPLKTIRVAAAVIHAGEKIFATQRGYGDWKDYWEFPGGKIELGETPEDALYREIQEELDTKIKIIKKVTTIEYDYPNFHLSMDCFLAEVKDGDLVLKEHENSKWLHKDELYSVRWLPADELILPLLQQL